MSSGDREHVDDDRGPARIVVVVVWPRLGKEPAMSTAGNFPTMPISCCAIPSTAACKSRRTDARKIPGLRYDRKARCPPFPREPLWAKIQVREARSAKPVGDFVGEDVGEDVGLTVGDVVGMWVVGERQASASPLNGRPQSPRGDDDEASYSVLRPTGRQEPIPSPRELWRCPRPNVVWRP